MKFYNLELGRKRPIQPDGVPQGEKWQFYPWVASAGIPRAAKSNRKNLAASGRVFYRLTLLAVVFSSFILGGCAELSGIGTDNASPPSPLPTIQAQYAAIPIWTKRAGKGVGKDYLKLGPVAADDKVYIADVKGKVYALDARTGKTLWDTKTKAPLTSGPSLGEGILVLGTADAQIMALNPNTGAIIWRAKTPDQVLAAAEIADNRVIVNTISGKLAAYSTQNGQSLWAYDHGAPTLILRGGSLPQVAGDRVIAGFSDGKLAAFDINQGHIIWQQVIATPQGFAQVQQMVDIVANPIINDGIIYVATYQGKVAAVSLETGKILWLQNISSYTGLVVAPLQVLVTDAAGNIWAFDRSSGKMLWKQTQLANRRLTAPALFGNSIVVADGEGYVHWLALADGHFLARDQVIKKKAILAPPSILGDTVYVGAQNGLVAAYSLSNPE